MAETPLLLIMKAIWLLIDLRSKTAPEDFILLSKGTELCEDFMQIPNLLTGYQT